MRLATSKPNGLTVVLLLAATNIVYLLMVFFTIPLVMSYSENMKLFDLCASGYSVEYAHQLLGTLGETGSQAYITYQLSIDTIYPLLFGVCYLKLYCWLVHNNQLSASFWTKGTLIPLIVAVFDYVENACVFFMLLKFPALPDTLVWFASGITVLKSMTTLVCLAMLAALALLLSYKKIALR
jgi:hypothetical protein